MTQVVKTVMPIESFATKIVNVVAMGDVNKPLDLGYICRLFKKVAYRPKRFPGLIFKPKNSEVSIMAFNSGKIVCSGARSVRQAKIAITGFVDKLRTNGLDFLDDPNVQAQNIVAHSDFKRSIDLEILAELLEKSIYEPEQFPGLIYVMSDPKVTFLIFTNGKLVCTGARNEEAINKALITLYQRLEACDVFFEKNLN
jgi:transcription initiation factor TFIID TATA-box-binding protein